METYTLSTLAGILATALSVSAFIPYISSILKKETRPSGASWWTWSLLAVLTVTSSRAAGAPLAVLILPLWLCFSQLLVAFLSRKHGDNNWDTLNKFCVFGALAGAVLWAFTGQPIIALLISIASDFFASIPNFRHIFKNPEQENRLAWTLGFGSALLEMFTIKVWSVAESGWAIYFLFNMGIVLILVWRKNLSIKNSN
jgi:hypothetical protein